MWLRKAAIGLGLAAATYLAALVVASWVVAATVERDVQHRLATTLDGTATVGDATVSLLRGSIAVTGVHAERHHLGTLALDVDRIELDVAPLGAFAVVRSPRALRVTGGHLVVTGAGALDGLERGHAQVDVGAVELRASELTLAVTSLWPELARVHLVLDRVRAGPTRFRTPLSWVFTLDELDARVELPGGSAFTLAYRDGALTARGGLFGAAPITVPVDLRYRAGVDETVQLRALAFELGKRLAVERARRWFLGRALELTVRSR